MICSYKAVQYTAIIPGKLAISKFWLVKVDFHNKLSDLQEQSYGISYTPN